jgi:hypothetical protein
MTDARSRRGTFWGAILLAASCGVADDSSSVPPEPVGLVRSAVITTPGVQVYVAYAENERPSPFWPNPWLGSPNTQFLGYPGPAYDTGAILIRNSGTSNVTLGPGARVDGFQDGSVYQLWDGLIGSGVTIAPGQQVILAQTQADSSSASCTRGPASCLSNFDSSDTPVASPQSAATPVIHLTLNGSSQTATDTGQILNNGGFDFGNSVGRNESVQWRLVGTTGMSMSGGSGVNPAAVTTWHNDSARTGLNPDEPTLNPTNVNPATFGKLFAYPVDGQIYAQPLFVPNLSFPGGGVHDAVFVATENNTVYAFDAEGNASGGVLWSLSLGPAVTASEICADNVSPSFGVTGTPVIDPTTNTLYVVAKTTTAPGVYATRLHALDLLTGAEKLGGPVTIRGSVAGTGDGSSGGFVSFDPKWQFQRAALLLSNGTVYVAFGSHCDRGPYHGWVFGYNASNIAQRRAIFNTSPNAVTTTPAGCDPEPGGGAIWMAGAGPASDGTNIFVTTGNGTFDANAGGRDYGDSILKLLPSGGTLAVSDYFTPFDQSSLNCTDADLGSSGPVLLPTQGGPNPSLLLQTTKTGKLYLVNRTTGSMGTFNAGCTAGPSCDRIVQEIPGAVAGGAWSTPAVFNNSAYVGGVGDVIKSFAITNGVLATAPFAETPTSFAYPGTTPSISASQSDPSGTGIVWALENAGGQAVLHAYAAADLHELYSSGLRPSDGTGGYINFTVPTVAAGKVFVGTRSELAVYGGAFFADTPVIAPSGGPVYPSTMVTLTSATQGSTIRYTLDGSDPTAASAVYTAPFPVTFTVGGVTDPTPHVVKARSFPSASAATYTFPAGGGGGTVATATFNLLSTTASPDTTLTVSPLPGNTFSTTSTIDLSSVANPAPQLAYQSERFGDFSYAFGSRQPDMLYEVRLHFAEIYFTAPASTGLRVFNVLVNGAPALSNFDMFALAGANRALVHELYARPDASNTITVQYQSIPGKDNAKSSAVEVIPISGYAVAAGGPIGYFGADSGFSPGGALFSTSNAIDTSFAQRAGTPMLTTLQAPALPQAVYQTHRFGNLHYVFGSLAPNAQYWVRLHFAETYWTAPGQRLFDVYVNGALVLGSFDIFGFTGQQNKAAVAEVRAQSNDLGKITVDYYSVVDNALSNGIEILPVNVYRTNTFKVNDGIHYITAENDGGGAVSTNRTAVGASEVFTIEDLDGGALMSGDQVRIRHDGLANNQRWYATADANASGQGGGGGPGSLFRVNRVVPAQWETFTILKDGGGPIASGDPVHFLSFNSFYASAISGGGLVGDGSVVVDRTQPSVWETFTIQSQ